MCPYEYEYTPVSGGFSGTTLAGGLSGAPPPE